MAIWKPIPGFENYEASDDGQVRCTGYMVYRQTKGPYPVEPHIVTPVFDRDGYMKVRLNVGKNRRTKRFVHRLVAVAHIPNPNGLPQINHIDGDKTNNSANNLEWCDCKHNHFHRRYVLKKNIGAQNGMAKLTPEIVRLIRLSNETDQALATHYGVSRPAIGYARRRVTWRHV